jgi:hypothetical protein
MKEDVHRQVTRGVELPPIMAVSAQQQVADEHKVTLRIRQQPIHARICGFGEKDRRPIDPPPIIELLVARGPTFDVQDLPFYVLHCTLVSADGHEELTIMAAEPKNVRILMGTLVSSVYHLHDVDGRPGHFFVFPDLSIRTEGQYRLKFSLMNVKISAQSMFGGNSHVIHECLTDPFTAYTAKKFPGMMESSKLMKCFAKQGLKLVIRGASSGNSAKANSEDADVGVADEVRTRCSKGSSADRENSNGSSMMPPSLTHDDETR